MSTFPVSKVKLATQPIKVKMDSLNSALHFLTGQPIEACGSNAKYDLVQTWSKSPMHAFLGTLHAAFDKHYPVAITPDDIWLCISQGLAMHINANPEKYRKQFVAHEDKMLLRHDNYYRKGDPTTDWTQSFSWFSEKIKDQIGKKHNLIVANFSTTGMIEKAASEIVLMEAMQNYFDYRERTLCGIPEVTLLGTEDDWKNIRARAQALSEFDLVWWTDVLDPVLEEFVRAKKGNSNKDFWTSFYKWNDGSGGSSVTGYVNRLFPYIKSGKTGLMTNPQLKRMDAYEGISPSDFPIGLSIAPFIWEYFETEYEMDFLGGFVGTVQNPESMEVQTALGWAVRDRPKAK